MCTTARQAPPADEMTALDEAFAQIASALTIIGQHVDNTELGSSEMLARSMVGNLRAGAVDLARVLA